MKRRLVLVTLFLFLFSFLAACSTTKKEGTTSSLEASPRASYYDFDDIRIPSEMKLNKKDSFVYTSARLKVGVLTFSGRVDPDSLAEFFLNNMPQDKWQPLSTLKYRGTMLVFLKGDRACVITIREGIFSTDLEVRVGPVEQAMAGQVKGVTPR